MRSHPQLLFLSIGLGLLLLFTSACQPAGNSSSDASATETESESTRPAAQQIPERENTVPRVSPDAIVGQTIGLTEVRITYGRPSVRGRRIFGDLVPFDEVWRTGANEATAISFSTPVRIEGKSLDAGTYGLFTIPGTDQWTIIFNDEAEQWGAYNYDSEQDALRVDVEPESAPTRELMTFTFDKVTDSTATSALHWAETRVPVEISTNTMEILRTRAEENVPQADNWQLPLQYASYALDNDILLNEARNWVNRSIEIEERFVNLRMKAHVLAASGQFQEAVDAANAAVSKAEGMDETPDGLNELQGQIETWESEV